jgi:magnesium-transporting ATPase (P-type)
MSATPAERVDLERVAFSMLLSGIVATPLAAIALRWPDPALVLAMVAAGGVIGTFGIFDLAAAMTGGTLPSVRAFFLGHGAASVGFGLVTASIPVASPEVARTLAVTWLGLYALFLTLLVWRLWYAHHVRRALMLWCGANAVIALFLAVVRPMPELGLLYAGAAYTVAFGVMLMAAGLWIQHDLARLNAATRAPVAPNRGGVQSP